MPDWFLSGGPLMWPLLFCSFLVLTVVLERLWFWSIFSRRLNPKAVEENLKLISQQHIQEAINAHQDSRDPALIMIRESLVGLTQFDKLGALLSSAAKQQLAIMRRGQAILDTMITLTPMLGILGTVLGIIQSFEVLGNVGVDNPREVVGGIAQALITTAVGLAIAAFALVPFNRFRHLLHNQALRLEKIGTQVEAYLVPASNTHETPVQTLKVL